MVVGAKKHVHLGAKSEHCEVFGCVRRGTKKNENETMRLNSRASGERKKEGGVQDKQRDFRAAREAVGSGLDGEICVALAFGHCRRSPLQPFSVVEKDPLCLFSNHSNFHILFLGLLITSIISLTLVTINSPLSLS